jgi:hypothetical protein
MIGEGPKGTASLDPVLSDRALTTP